MWGRAAKWKRAPFIRLLAPLAIGIWLNDHSQPAVSSIAISLLASIALLFVLQVKWLDIPYRYRWIPGIAITLALLLTGCLLHYCGRIENRDDWIGTNCHDYTYFKSIVASHPVTKGKYCKVTLKVFAGITASGKLRTTRGSVIAYISPSTQTALVQGSTVWFPSGKIKPIIETNNPGAFDFKAFAARQDIHHTAYLNDGDLVIPAGQRHHAYYSIIGKLQKSFHDMVSRFIQPKPSRALALALLIGYRDDLDKELLQAYVNTGVVHVIAVSGMHLGLIFLLLQKITRLNLTAKRKVLWLKSILVLICIWVFSLTAGASASVIRAAFMFSFTQLSNLLRKSIDPAQLLSCSAFCLLCFEPEWLFDAGFQLSFAALTGIIYYQPAITSLLQPQNKILQALWELSAVSLAAQILTLPISIGLFRQTPVYFLLGNILAVPLSNIALVLGLVTYFLQWIPKAPDLFGWVTGTLIQWMNHSITSLDQLPGSVINGLQWTFLQVILAFTLILTVTLCFITTRRIFLMASLILLFLFGLEGFRDHYLQSKQELLVIYHRPGRSGIELILGTSSYLLYHPKTRYSQDLQRSCHSFYRVNRTKPLPGQLITYKNHKIAIPWNHSSLPGMLEQQPDYLILTQPVYWKPEWSGKLAPTCLVILDASLPEKAGKKLETILQQQGIRYYNIRKKGALISDLAPQ
ncbi:ComEC family competence protein [Flavihumibacter rivuli]|uniref:ComEC/Rec2 family competence protein n=1 Tax=Flavihumibacter rivuli TaxID=2838156 RepID=UPI001BDF3E49|nr:ComEC/Rec2 family competence protein [Flavihumibacter rivuli]ULQ55137.1 ComEC family competence protein [Flavihumibacter rivuli]